MRNVIVRAGMGVVLAGGLVACSSEPPPAPEKEDRALQEAIQVPLDKANAVEDQVLKAQQDQQKKIDEQGG